MQRAGAVLHSAGRRGRGRALLLEHPSNERAEELCQLVRTAILGHSCDRHGSRLCS
jgi:hypothetical protein